MYKKYWKELLIIGLVTYSFVGLIIVLLFFTKKWLALMNKVAYDGEKPKLVPVSFNGKEAFYKDDNGNFQPMMVLDYHPKYNTSGFMMLCTVLSIFTCWLPLFIFFIH